MIGFEEIEEVIRNSYFNQDDEITEQVLEEMKLLNLSSPDESMNLIRVNKEQELLKRNLYAISWRTIERSKEYPFEVGEEVRVKGERYQRKIRKLYSRSGIRMADFENFTCPLSLLEYPPEEKVQMSIFD